MCGDKEDYKSCAICILRIMERQRRSEGGGRLTGHGSTESLILP